MKAQRYCPCKKKRTILLSFCLPCEDMAENGHLKPGRSHFAPPSAGRMEPACRGSRGRRERRVGRPRARAGCPRTWLAPSVLLPSFSRGEWKRVGVRSGVPHPPGCCCDCQRPLLRRSGAAGWRHVLCKVPAHSRCGLVRPRAPHLRAHLASLRT